MQISHQFLRFFNINPTVSKFRCNLRMSKIRRIYSGQSKRLRLNWLRTFALQIRASRVACELQSSGRACRASRRPQNINRTYTHMISCPKQNVRNVRFGLRRCHTCIRIMRSAYSHWPLWLMRCFIRTCGTIGISMEWHPQQCIRWAGIS